MLHDPERAAGTPITGLNILDVAPTILALMGLPVPPDMEGQPLPEVTG